MMLSVSLCVVVAVQMFLPLLMEHFSEPELRQLRQRVIELHQFHTSTDSELLLRPFQTSTDNRIQCALIGCVHIGDWLCTHLMRFCSKCKSCDRRVVQNPRDATECKIWHWHWLQVGQQMRQRLLSV